jgi:hypothetical protein
MNTIPAQTNSLAGVLADMASQTQSTADYSTADAANRGQTEDSSASDVLDISSSTPNAAWSAAVREIELNGQGSSLTDSSAASAANDAASAFLSGNAFGPLAAQGNLDPNSVLSLLQEA